MGPLYLQHASARQQASSPPPSPCFSVVAHEPESEREWRLSELAKLLAKGYLRLRETRLRASPVTENPSSKNSENSSQN